MGVLENNFALLHFNGENTKGDYFISFKEEQDINQMGGVWKKIPYTYALMIIGTLALTGFPFLSGFYSKDAIIEFSYLKGNTTGILASYVGILTAFLTSVNA